MDMNLTAYILKANLFLLFFYGFYFVFFRKETFHKANRYFLVIGAFFAMLLPFVRSSQMQKTELVPTEIQAVAYNLYFQSEEVIASPVVETYSNLDILKYIYLAGLIVAGIVFLARITKTIFWLKSNKNANGTAFSFLGKIFIDNHLEQKSVIFKHEDIHVKQKHFLDLIFFEILQLLFWFNPIIYFYKKSISIIHEFLADEEASKITHDKIAYASLLISKQFSIQPSTVFTQHFFNHSTLKSRIIMLSKNPSKKTALLKYGLLAPLFFLILVVSSFTVDKNTDLKTVLEKTENNIILNTITKSSLFSFEEIGFKENIIHSKISDKQEDNAVISLNFLSSDEDVQIDNFNFPNSQNDTIPQGKTPKAIFTVAEQNPEFVGGSKELYKWLASKIKYPKAAQRANVSGRVFVKFIVEDDGSISDVIILKGIGFGCDEEAVRVVQNMPKWNPGIQNGRPVAVYYNMPIVFNLEGANEGKKGIEDNEKIGVTDFNNSNESKIVGTFPLGVKREMPVEIKINGAFENALIFVNDIEILDKKMNDISPSSIESVSVLKNHEAIKAYGPRAKDGVILIKTKTNFIKTDEKK